MTSNGYHPDETTIKRELLMRGLHGNDTLDDIIDFVVLCMHQAYDAGQRHGYRTLAERVKALI